MSEASEPKPGQWGWTLAQRRGLLVLLTVLLSFLAFRTLRNRTYVSDPQPSEGPRAAELQSRIDPNSADWQTLAAIPGLGEKRARTIIAYREGLHAANSGRVAFHGPTDLLRVRGIGIATVENLRPYLIFPSDEPSTHQ